MVVEGVLIGLATDSAKGLVQFVAARVMDEIHLAWGFKDQLKKLNRKFEYIQAFLEDATNSKYVQKSKQVKLWVQSVKDAAFLADNVMDEYAIEMFRRKMELKNQRKKKLCISFPISKPNLVFFHFRMAHKVKEIISLFDEIDKVAKDIGLRPVDVVGNSPTDTSNYDGHLGETRQHAVATASEFVGRVDDQTKLLDVICSPTAPTNDRHHLSTIAVIGMGGLGKTTLARRLCSNERICAHFSNVKIWICVAQNFEITRFLNEMVESVTSERSKLTNIETIKRKLEEKLKGKKLLLVLDDVWNENQGLWDTLKDTLLDIGIAPGSVILITTRSDEVANAAGVVFPKGHKLKGLSKDESWSLLCQRAPDISSRPNYNGLEEVGKRIVEKCKGVPLAIKVIGGVLQSKQGVHEWEAIEESELWESPHGQNQILPSLLLSFNYLPSPSLKQCFAYYAVVPKRSLVYKSELIGLWLSQGYLRNDKEEKLTVEQIGEKNLKILLSNSLLEEVMSIKNGLNFVCYKMHDLVYDLAVYVCGSDLIKETKDLLEAGTCRHLVINSKENKPTPDVLPEKALRKLRTLDLMGTDIQWNMLSHMRYLRTLILDRTSITELPPAVALLKHLRFLDVSHSLISTLPDSIGKLYELQTLVLQGCKNMKKLPKVVNKLVNLRYISTTAPMFAYKGLHQLTNLQILPYLSLDVDGEGWSIDELGDLHELRDEICIQGLECVKDKENARKARLAAKPNITKLSLSWIEERSETSEVIYDEDVLEGLEPHPNITSLKVQNFIGVKFPTWVTEVAVAPSGNRTLLNNLTEVKLLNCRKCKTLPKLGQLPLLKCLILSGLDVESIDSEFYLGGGDLQMCLVPFISLKELEISEFGKLTTWEKPPKVAFPRLTTLRITDCWKLKSVPALGTESLISLQLTGLLRVESLDIINYSSGLTSLIMDGMSNIKSLPEELANCRKLQILHISNFAKLASLPKGLESLVNLQSMIVRWCDALDFVMDDFRHVRSTLRNFEIAGCPRLRKIPRSLEECTYLKTLSILKCPLAECSPTNISKLQQLSELKISCSSAKLLISVLKVAQCLPVLYKLGISGFRDDNEMKEYFSDMTPLLRLPSLRHVTLCGHPNIKTLPQQLGLLTRTTHLCFWEFDDLEEIPNWICQLSSLECLILEECKNLKSIPSKDYLKRLAYIGITNCPKLVERYNKEQGPEWHNISHIKWIFMNGKKVQDLKEQQITYYE